MDASSAGREVSREVSSRAIQVDFSERLTAPVLFVVFNRPETTREVFESIRAAKPPRLYIGADGPRDDHPEDERNVDVVRDYITSQVDWECEVMTLFQDRNQGCKAGVSTAITWFFEHEESGIILEDDCVPDPSFFYFCEQLLEKYRGNEKVMHVGGSCLIKNLEVDESYFFSRYSPVWGWATWRDAWARYSLTTGSFEDEFAAISRQFDSEEERSYWRKTLSDYFAGRIDTWDYPWNYAIWKHGGLSIYPTRNLVKNIGFGTGSTHTRRWSDYRGLGDAEVRPIHEIVHPRRIAENPQLDQRAFAGSYRKHSKVVVALKILRRMAVELFPKKTVRGESDDV
ncbi:MAG: hypothetical protein JJE13_04505 [Thermoleophilia bacterium]|nr:hypothetical protein [Thermoleophilia bacterium]